MEKVVRDGKVAVLYAPNYGAGWSTWNTECEACLYDPEIVAMVEKGEDTSKVLKLAEAKWPEGYWNAAHDLKIYWVPQGWRFKIDEFDGAEDVCVVEDTEWKVA